MAYSLAKHLLGINFSRTLLGRLNLSVPGPALTNTIHRFLQRFLEVNFLKLILLSWADCRFVRSFPALHLDVTKVSGVTDRTAEVRLSFAYRSRKNCIWIALHMDKVQTVLRGTGIKQAAMDHAYYKKWHWQVLGSGSLSSPMREHRNFAQFYCISVTNFSTVSECILLEFIWIKRTFSLHSYGCFYVCIACASWFSTGGICHLSSANHVVRDMNENSRCVYLLGDKAIRVVHSNMWYHWIGNWMLIPVV